MKKILIAFVLLIVAAVAVLLLARNFIVKKVLTEGIKSAAGLEIRLGKVDIGLFSPTAEIRDLKVFNPSGFNAGIMADIPRVYVAYDVGSLMKQSVHLPELAIEIAEVNITQDIKLRTNLSSLALLVPKPSGEKQMQVKIDTLRLKVGKVFYSNRPLAGGEGVTAKIGLNIDETFHDVTDPQKIARQFVSLILSGAGISGLRDLDVKGLNNLSQQGDGLVDEVKGGVQGLKKGDTKDITATADKILKLFETPASGNSTQSQ